MINCAKCNKELEDEKGQSITGMMIRITASGNISPEFVQKQMGKYEIGKDYNFCFECLLDTLMGVK